MILLDTSTVPLDVRALLRSIEVRDLTAPVVVAGDHEGPELPPELPFVAKSAGREAVLAAIESRCPPQVIEEPAKVVARLYVRDGCPKSVRASQIFKSVVSDFEAGEMDCQVIDVAGSVAPHPAPTLVLDRPLSITIPGGPTSKCFLLSLFAIAEVRRRR